MHTRKSAVRFIAALVAASACHNALAAPIVNIATGLSLALQPGGTGSLTMALQNDGDAFAEINFYGFALMFVPTSGTGTMPFSAWSAPASNPLLGGTTFYDPEGTPATQDLTSPVSIDGQDYYSFYLVTGLNDDGLNYQLLPTQTKNVGTLNFTAGPEIEGNSSWDIYVVSQSYSSPGFPPSFTATAALVPAVFGNLLGEDGAKLKIGTVTVAAVPEPGTISLTVIGFLSARWAARRRSCCKK